MIIQDKTNIHISARLKYRHHNGVWSEYITGTITKNCYDFLLNSVSFTQSSSGNSNLIVGKLNDNSRINGLLTNIGFGSSENELDDNASFNDIGSYESSTTSYIIDTDNNRCVTTQCTINSVTYSIGHKITTESWRNRLFFYNNVDASGTQNIEVVFNLQNEIQPNDYETLVEFKFEFDDTLKQGFDSIGRGFHRKIINRIVTQNGIDYSNLLPGMSCDIANGKYDEMVVNGVLVRSGSGLFIPHIKNDSCSMLSSVAVSNENIPYNATLTNELQDFPTQETNEQLNFARSTPQSVSINTTNRVVNYRVQLSDNNGCMIVFRGAYYLFDNGYSADAYNDDIILEMRVGFDEIAEEINPEDIADKSKMLQYHRLVVDDSSESLEYKHGRYGISTQTGINCEEPEIEWKLETTVLIKTPNRIVDLINIPDKCRALNLYVAAFDYERDVKQRDYEKTDLTYIVFRCSDYNGLDFKINVYWVDNGFDDLTQYEPIEIVNKPIQYFRLHYILKVQNNLAHLFVARFNHPERPDEKFNCEVNISWNTDYIENVYPAYFKVKEGTTVNSVITRTEHGRYKYLSVNKGIISGNTYTLSVKDDENIFIDSKEYWSGHRDYSFYDKNEEILHIYTPEQYAALTYITNGNCSTDPENTKHCMKSTLEGKTVLLEMDLIFNYDYANNKNWVELNEGQNRVSPPENDCSLLRLRGFKGTFDGQFHKILGLFYHKPNQSSTLGDGDSFNYIAPGGIVKNLYIENCSLKNYRQGFFAIFQTASDVTFENVQIRNCRVVASSNVSGGTGSVPFGILAYSSNGSTMKIYGCSIINSDCALYDYSGYASYRNNGLMFACWDYGPTMYNCFESDVNCVYYSSGYNFTRSPQSAKNNYYKNVNSNGSNATQVQTDEALISSHNSGYSDGKSLKIDENLRYISELI